MAHDIGWAMNQMEAGKKVRRAEWCEGKHIALEPHAADGHDLCCFVYHERCHWISCQHDLLAEVWEKFDG